MRRIMGIMKRKLINLTYGEIDKITHLYANGFNDNEWLAERFNLEMKDVEELTKEVKAYRDSQPKFKPGDKFIITISEESFRSGSGFKYVFEELPGIQFDEKFVENELKKLANLNDIQQFMEELSPEEREKMNKYIDDHSYPTGINIWDELEGENE